MVSLSLLSELADTTLTHAKVKEQERLKQEAINNRKRSSRIATRELEKEELLRREQAQREMEERMEKMRSERETQDQGGRGGTGTRDGTGRPAERARGASCGSGKGHLEAC